jgi:uracil-DNA glycosylase family 4
LQNWAALEAEIISCRRCPRLVEWREGVARTKRRAYQGEVYWGKPVPGFGDRCARVLVVGLAPAAHGANRTGRMFTGDSSGNFLYAALFRAGFADRPMSLGANDGLTLHDVFVSAACRCAPPDNRPTPGELAACLPFLAGEMALLPELQVIVALGHIAFEAVLRMYPEQGRATPRLRFGHALAQPLGAARPWLVASYHPSRQNTQTGRLTPEMFDEVWSTTRALLA